MVPNLNWSQPDITDEDYHAIKPCFETNWISQGARVIEFEALVAESSSRKYCVAVNSGSSALICLLIGLGITPDSEVVIPAMSFIAVPYAVSSLGATPVLADVNKTSGVIDLESVLACVSIKTKAVIGIDYSGFASDWRPLSRLCEELGIHLIIDSASSFLASNTSGPAGCQGLAAIFSFHAAKILTTGEGGAIVTDDEDLSRQLRRIRNYGEIPGRKYSYDTLGNNYRMTDISASLGISQIKRKETILAARRGIIDAYLESKVLRDICLPLYNDNSSISNGFTFTILTERREEVRNGLSLAGIETRVMWPLTIDRQPIYQELTLHAGTGNEVAQYFSESCLSLPVHSRMSKRDSQYIVANAEGLLSPI